MATSKKKKDPKVKEVPGINPKDLGPELSLDPTEPSLNGQGKDKATKDPGNRPWMEKLMMQDGAGQNFSPILEMSRGSTDPAEYLMRTVFRDQEDQQDFLLEISQVFRMTHGYSDSGLINWLDLQSRPSIGGASRDMVKQMFIGERERLKEMASGLLRRGRAVVSGEEAASGSSK